MPGSIRTTLAKVGSCSLSTGTTSIQSCSSSAGSGSRSWRNNRNIGDRTSDHGPLPQEAIESTVYLSNDLTTWTQAVVERVWMEGFMSNTGILWDGFTYAVGTGTSNTFRYASVIHGGPGALINHGDDEINGVMGLTGNFTQNVPEPA